ncbi:hypothetical protein BSKO_13636 [Bryopsis sp. KO-2023]|nr:hypothetical protein BSKO_13636 [Bryopsis sp. KO-2023]
MAAAGIINKADFFETIAVAKAISTSVQEKIQEYPNGALLQIREVLDTELPATVQSIDCNMTVAELRQMIDIAEGYESFVRFPEKTVRYAIKIAMEKLEQPFQAEMAKIKKFVVTDVKASFEECRAELLKKAGNQRAAEDLEARAFAHCDAILSTWFKDANKMVEQLVAMEHEMPDIKILRQLFRENGRKELQMTQEKPRDSVPAETPDSRRFIMGHLDKRNEKTGGWAMRWCVVQPKTQQLFVHKDASREPLYAVDMSKMQLVESISAKKKEKGAVAKQSSSRIFILKPLDPSESTVPHKHRTTLRFRAPSHQVKELWMQALEPLCGRVPVKTMGKVGLELPSEPTDIESAEENSGAANLDSVDSLEEGPISKAENEPSALKNGADGDTEYHPMDMEENIEVFSKALVQYIDRVKEQILVTIPKAVVHLFVEKVEESFAETLTNRLVESL